MSEDVTETSAEPVAAEAAPAAPAETAPAPAAAPAPAEGQVQGQGPSQSQGQGQGHQGQGQRPQHAHPRRPSGPRRFSRRKVCQFCADKIDYIDYKDTKRVRKFMTDRGKILPRRITGNCAAHQRMLTNAIKRARIVALVPFKSE